MRSNDILGTRRKARLGALLADASGNTLAMTAAAILPLLAIAGGAIDIGRMYYAKNQLQFACDAAVLAGRKTMAGKTLDAGTTDAVNAFFHNNYKEGLIGTSETTITPEVQGDGLVHATASTKIPMAIMQFFGYSDREITVDCTAARNVGNTDVMFVLDTTMSMNLKNDTDSVTRLEALKEAVREFYNVLPAKDNGAARVRYGFMPFSNNVNVGADVKQWLAHDWYYQTRRPKGFKTVTSTSDYIYEYEPVYVESGTYTVTEEYYEAEVCLSPAKTHVNNTRYDMIREETQANGDVWVYYKITSLDNGIIYTDTREGLRCKRRSDIYDQYKKYRYYVRKPHKSTSTASYHNWEYDRIRIDVSNMRNGPGSAITWKMGARHTDLTYKWQGCIEERKTVWLTHGSDSSEALDLNIDLVPDMSDTNNDEGTQWGPSLPELIWGRQYNGTWSIPKREYAENEFVPPWMGTTANMANFVTCPSAAQKLKTMDDLGVVNKYLATLVPGGSTYLDIGMIWGARYLSPKGIFKSENEKADNGDPISRNIILMTDGQVEANPLNVTSYGFEMLDRRRVDGNENKFPTETDMNEVVADRFVRACANAKNKGMTVWVVAFGTDLTNMLRECSSNNRAYKANDAAQLRSAFSDIATRIGKLRLTK